MKRLHVHGTRRALARTSVLVAALFPLACTPSSSSSAKEPAIPPPQVIPAEQPPAQVAAAPMMDQNGEPLQVIWTRTEKGNEHAASDGGSDLYATRVGINTDSLAFDLKSEGHSSSEDVGKREVPTISLLVDGCPVAAPPIVAAALPYNGSDARLTIGRRGLPKGDLTVTFTAFSLEHTMLLANDERGLRTITLEEMKNVKIRPADPARGLPETVSVTPPKCD